MSESKLRQRLSEALALQREIVGVLGSLPETPFSGYLREVASYDAEIRRAVGALPASRLESSSHPLQLGGKALQLGGAGADLGACRR